MVNGNILVNGKLLRTFCFLSAKLFNRLETYIDRLSLARHVLLTCLFLSNRINSLCFYASFVIKKVVLLYLRRALSVACAVTCLDDAMNVRRCPSVDYVQISLILVILSSSVPFCLDSWAPLEVE